MLPVASNGRNYARPGYWLTNRFIGKLGRSSFGCPLRPPAAPVILSVAERGSGSNSRQKVAGYLLSIHHESGAGKAEFFIRFGFNPLQWEALAVALRAHVVNNQIASTLKTNCGTAYVVEGKLESPDGRNPWVRSVWFVDTGSQIPRLVTAYPIMV